MAALTITHTHEDGTLLDGSRKGDGVWDVLRYRGWRPFRSIGMLGIPHTRDKVAQRVRINADAELLRAAGHEVTVEIDDTLRDRDTVLADQAARLEDRAERLNERAGRHAAAADASLRRADQISGAFEGGQPILVGHHSERRARRDQERMHTAMARSVAEDKTAAAVAERAAAVGSQAAHVARPDATARRIERLEKELRDAVERLDGRAPTTDYLTQLTAEVAQLGQRIAHDRAQVQAAIDAGEWVWHDKGTVHVGDRVHCHGLTAGVIAKVNKVTVDVQTRHMPWPLKQRYTDIVRVVCTHTTVEES